MQRSLRLFLLFNAGRWWFYRTTFGVIFWGTSNSWTSSSQDVFHLESYVGFSNSWTKPPWTRLLSAATIKNLTSLPIRPNDRAIIVWKSSVLVNALLILPNTPRCSSSEKSCSINMCIMNVAQHSLFNDKLLFIKCKPRKIGCERLLGILNFFRWKSRWTYKQRWHCLHF